MAEPLRGEVGGTGTFPALPTVVSAAQARSRGLYLLRGRGWRGGWHPAAAGTGAAEAGLVHHPMWAVRFGVQGGPRGLSHVLALVDAVTGRAHMIAEPLLACAVVDAAGAARGTVPMAAPHRAPTVTAAQAVDAARATAATAVRKRAKLSFLFSLTVEGEPAVVLKPNWYVRARESGVSAQFLLDGLDGTHYVIAYHRAED